jgi:serine protease
MKPVRRWRATAPTSVGLILTLALMLSLLGSAAGSAAPAASAAEVGLSFTVDPDLQPAQSTLGPAREGDPPRQLASVADAYGNQADFVADELVLVSDDAAAVDAFAARWGGEMLVTFDPAEYGLPELRPQYLVRIDPNRADSARLEADLSEANPEARGAHRVSSPDGLALLAVAARETNRGLRVGVNWVVRFEEVRNRTSIEDPVAPFPPHQPECLHLAAPLRRG